MSIVPINERRDYTRLLEERLLWAYGEIERLGGRRPDKPPLPTQLNNERKTDPPNIKGAGR